MRFFLAVVQAQDASCKDAGNFVKMIGMGGVVWVGVSQWPPPLLACHGGDMVKDEAGGLQKQKVFGHYVRTSLPVGTVPINQTVNAVGLIDRGEMVVG